MKKVVTIGGGNGTALVLQALKQHHDQYDIAAVVSTSDSGGSSGRLRQEFGTLPPGDILRAVLALSSYDYQFLKEIFYSSRFADADQLNDHNLGNLFLTFCQQYTNDFVLGIRALSQAVKAIGTVYPVTTDSTDLVAELESGSIVRTEAAIDRPNYDRADKIKKVWLDPAPNVYEGAKVAIEAADWIILDPGSLYTSTIATLLPDGVSEAIQRSKAKLLLVVARCYEIDGETGPTQLSGLVHAVETYLPRKLDVIVYNEQALDEKQLAAYAEKHWQAWELDKENLVGYPLYPRDFENSDGGVSPDHLASIFKEIL